MWYIIIALLLFYMYKTHRAFYTKGSEGNHRWGENKFYQMIPTGEHMALNNDWRCRGTETHFGFLGWGSIGCTNSYRRRSIFKYVSLMFPFPTFEVGIEIGFVSGYTGYKTGLMFGDWMFGIVPKIRWADPSKKNSFITFRQFSSASVTTTGITNKKPIL